MFLLFAAGMDLVRALSIAGLEAIGVFDALYGPRDGSRSEASDALVQMWGYLTTMPVFLLIAYVVKSTRYLKRSSPGAHASGVMALVACCWLVFSFLTLLIHLIVQLLFFRMGWPIVEHPLANPETYRTALDRGLLIVQVCVAAPIIEEVMFRGVLLPWLLIRRSNVWPVFGAGLLLAAGPAVHSHGIAGLISGASVFAILLAAAWPFIAMLFRTKRTIVGAIYTSAAIFAIVHSAVWPSPIPLFVLGLGLGWLAFRLRGVLAPILVHGIFNLVSVLLVLRSP